MTEISRDKPWLFRTYAGHSTAAKSNALYRTNLAKGQTGLSVAFDLPTQTGYDSDHVLARGEVGKVGVPVSHIGDMRALFDQIPLEEMNTSMTINATAAWLLALYVAVAEEQGADISRLQGTVQNDIIKEYLSRGTYVFPPAPSLKLIGDVAEYCYRSVPKWNPMNVCSYHLQEAGATPEQELAFALATACAVLDQVKGQVSDEDFPELVSRISFFVNAGIRFVTEMCKMRAFVDLWDEITETRYGVRDARYRRFRYGVQVNSLGLTEQQPENNVYRILIEMLAVTLSKKARARAVQLPAWNEALGLPRPWDQQWSLRMQQIMAYETDLLEYGDLFDGNPAVEAKVAALKDGARAELARIDEMGGAVAAIDYMKGALVAANTARLGRPRPPPEIPGRQARARRPFQRRRADRRPRPRCRHGSGLRGNPPDARPDRERRAGGERPCRRPVDPVRLAPAARVRGDGADARGRAGGHPGHRRRHHPRDRRRGAPRHGRRPGLHAQGLRPEPHHARHRGPRGRRRPRRGVRAPAAPPDGGRRRPPPLFRQAAESSLCDPATPRARVGPPG